MIAIKFENISKQYRLGTIGTGTLSHDLNRWWKMNIQGREDPYLMVGQTNDVAKVRESEGAKERGSEYIWALKDINLEVEQGEVLGIIGKNGAGKSTLLKLLSRVTAPTTGRIRAWGRIASLLEVGTGFHSEMTGRENIYMNGSIMGMTKAEITRKFDEIVDFAGVERYIDTPVKRYSSGMTVRLGFAIAAHLEPEILVVDEVLAVGDAEFQKKAVGKMQDVSRNEGRTVLFVSHNMTAIKNLCQRGIILMNGSISYHSNNIENVVTNYIANVLIIDSISKKWEDLGIAPGNDYLKLCCASIENRNNNTNLYTLDDNIDIKFGFWSLKSGMNISITIEVFTLEQECVFKSTSNKINTECKKYTSELRIPSNFLNNNIYLFDFYFVRDDNYIEFQFKNILKLEIIELERNNNWHGRWIGVTRPNFLFKIFD